MTNKKVAMNFILKTRMQLFQAEYLDPAWRKAQVYCHRIFLTEGPGNKLFLWGRTIGRRVLVGLCKDVVSVMR